MIKKSRLEKESIKILFFFHKMKTRLDKKENRIKIIRIIDKWQRFRWYNVMIGIIIFIVSSIKLQINFPAREIQISTQENKFRKPNSSSINNTSPNSLKLRYIRLWEQQNSSNTSFEMKFHSKHMAFKYLYLNVQSIEKYFPYIMEYIFINAEK